MTLLIDKRKPEGNAFAIMGQVSLLLEAAGRADEWPDISARMKSGDYDNLCKVAEEVTYGSIKIVDGTEEDPCPNCDGSGECPNCGGGDEECEECDGGGCCDYCGGTGEG